MLSERAASVVDGRNAMVANYLEVISAMAEAVSTTAPRGTLAHPLRPVITLSRDYGSGGDIIAERLCQCLDLPLYDQELFRRVTEKLRDDPATVRLLDEGLGRVKDLWIYRLFSGREVGFDAYRDTLIKVVLTLGRMGGVIIGRGAHVILADACALRVRIAGSAEICARRMAKSGHGDEASELEKARDMNHRRGKFVWEMFKSRLSDAHQFDIVINTDRMDDFEDAVTMLVGMASAVHSGRVLTPQME
jgi:cytidylate kinase